MKKVHALVTASLFSLSLAGVALAGDPVVDALDRDATWSGFQHLTQGQPSEISTNPENVVKEGKSDSKLDQTMAKSQANSIDSQAKISLPEPD